MVIRDQDEELYAVSHTTTDVIDMADWDDYHDAFCRAMHKRIMEERDLEEDSILFVGAFRVNPTAIQNIIKEIAPTN